MDDMRWGEGNRMMYARGRTPGDGDLYIDKCDLVVRRNTTDHTIYTDPIVAGPFDSLDAAKAAYLVMEAGDG